MRAVREGRQQLVERTSLPNAVERILEITPENEVVSISRLAHMTSLNRKTVEKVLDVILTLENKLADREILLIETKGRKLVYAKRKEPGLLGLPLALQKMIIRTAYFPAPSREEEILTHLLLRHATRKESAIDLGATGSTKELLEPLLRQGQIASVEDHYYLTDEGAIVARGAMELYSELGAPLKKQAA